LFPGFQYLSWTTALGLACFFAYLSTRFGLMAEPEETGSGVGLFIFSFILFGSTQLGLLLTPWALSRGLMIRVVAAALMAPPAIFLGFVASEALERFMVGRPLSTLSSVTYFTGAGVYLLAYLELIRASLLGRRRPLTV
jgi:hypothetical protein